jgi:nitroreductase/dihydropteridine reductase
VVVTDPQVKELLRSASWGQPQITSCSHLLVFCANTDLDGTIDRLDLAFQSADAPEESRNMVIGGFDPQAYARILDIPAHLVPVAACPVGYAADQPMPKVRFPLDEVVF